MTQSSSFEVIYLGDLAVVDTEEGDNRISRERGEALLGSYGSTSDPLSNNIHMFDPGSTGYSQGSNAAYDADNNNSNDKFTIDGGPEQIFDALMNYTGTIKYTDGTIATAAKFHIMQDSDGKTYLIPPRDGTNSPFSAKPIQSITLNTLSENTAFDMFGQREADGFFGDPPDPEDTDESTVFDVIHLGQLPLIDDNNESSAAVNNANVDAIAHNTYGSKADPLYSHIQRWAPGSTGFIGGDSNAYDINNDFSNDTFTINGGPDKIYDASMVFKITITYTDGTISEEFEGLLVQAKDGHTYLAPGFGSSVQIQGAKPIQSITLGSPVYDQNGNGYNFWARNYDNQFQVPCFAATVPIQTPFGYIAASKLQVRDFVTTADHGIQQISWVGRRYINSRELAANPKLRPIRITKGALGDGLPTEDILVSRQHRMLVCSKIARNMFGADEVLVPAIKLTAYPGIEIADDILEVTYIHFLFERHEIVFAAGAPSESLFTGTEALKAISEEMRQEIFTLFPELESAGQVLKPARELLSNKMAKNLIARHAKKNRPLIEENVKPD